MPKRLLLWLLLSVASYPVLAQQESLESQTRKQRLRQQFLTNDTAQAIINLYGRRQGGGASWIVASGLSVARVATAPSNEKTVGARLGERPGKARTRRVHATTNRVTASLL